MGCFLTDAMKLLVWGDSVLAHFYRNILRVVCFTESTFDSRKHWNCGGVWMEMRCQVVGGVTLAPAWRRRHENGTPTLRDRPLGEGCTFQNGLIFRKVSNSLCLRTHWCFGIVLWSNIAASVQRKICNICFNKEMIPPPTLFETFPKKNPFWNPQPSLGPSCNVLHALAHPNVRSPGWGQLLQDAILGVNHSCADTYR